MAKRSSMRIALSVSVPPGVPVFRAFGDEDDHLRLAALIADAFRPLDAEASAACLVPDTPWRARLEALDDLLLASTRGNRLAMFVDPDALAPAGHEGLFEDPGFHRERWELFDALLHAARRGGWLLVRPWPRADLAERFAELEVDGDDSDEGLFGALAPGARPLASWLQGGGSLGEHRLQRLVEQGEDLSLVVLREACGRLAARRGERRLRHKREYPTLNGSSPHTCSSRCNRAHRSLRPRARRLERADHSAPSFACRRCRA